MLRLYRHSVMCVYREQRIKTPRRKLGQANGGSHESCVTVRVTQTFQIDCVNRLAKSHS